MRTRQPENPLFPALKAGSLWAYLALALAVFMAYSNIFANEFLFDDDLIIKFNDYLRSWSHIGDILTGSTTSGIRIEGGFYRPLQILLYLFAYQLGDGATFWFHALNLGLQIVNACLVYKLGTKMGFAPKGVFLAALVWGIHPIHTEAITYMSGTADPLFVVFCLWGLIVLLPDFSTRKVLKALPLLLLGLASKETMVVFPALATLTLFSISPNRFKPGTYRAIGPLWIIGIAYALWRVQASGFDGPQTYSRFYEAEGFSDLYLYAQTPFYRLYTFLATLPAYLDLLIWPTNLHMERAFPIYKTLNAGPVLAGMAMVVLAGGAAAIAARTNRIKALGWGVAWFGIAHVPSSGLVFPTNALFLEHWMYLPTIGLFLGLGQTAAELTKNRGKSLSIGLAVAALVFASVLSAKTHKQNRIWKDPASFYGNIFANGQQSARCHNNMALYHSKRGEYDDAIGHFNKAIGLSDVYAETRYNLALVYLNHPNQEDKIPKAIAQLERSLQIQPSFYRSYKALGDIHRQMLNDPEKANFYYKKAEEAFNNSSLGKRK